MDASEGNAKAPVLKRSEIPKTWEELPDEMLMKILEKPPSSSMLRCRLVCKRWKSIMEEILEADSYAQSSRVPDGPEPDVKERLKVLKPRTSSNKNLYAICPPALLLPATNPFPTRSLVCEGISSTHKLDEDAPQQPVISLGEVFISHGHHLTVLTLAGLKLNFDLLVGILKHTQNLKSLALYCMDVRVPENIVHSGISQFFPSLPQLKIILLEELEAYYTGETDQPISLPGNWIIEPYTSLLFKLQLDCLHNDMPPLTTPLTCLKCLYLSFPPKSFLQESSPAPLEYLTVVSFPGERYGSIPDIIKYTDTFADTLVQVNLNALSWDELSTGLGNGDLNLRSSYPIRGSSRYSSVCFQHLKVLSIPYARKESHIFLMSKVLLPKFPALEILQFIRLPPMYKQNEESVKIAEFLEREDYWSICPRLKKIKVFRHCAPKNVEEARNYVFMASRPLPQL